MRTHLRAVFTVRVTAWIKKKKKINLERAQREVQTQRVLSYLHLVVQRWNCAALKHHPVISGLDIHQSVEGSFSQLGGRDTKMGCVSVLIGS